MKKFAVAYIDFFDNNLVIEIVEAKDWYGAIYQHSLMPKEFVLSKESLQQAKNDAINGDCLIDVVEL